MRQSSILKEYYEDAINSKNIDISEDYSVITVACYKETADLDIFTAMTSTMCLPVYQLLDGVEPDDIGIELILKDGVTGEIVFTVSYPIEEEITIDADDFNFSPLPTDNYNE